jgi:DNA polymerase III psi subunit
MNTGLVHILFEGEELYRLDSEFNTSGINTESVIGPPSSVIKEEKNKQSKEAIAEEKLPENKLSNQAKLDQNSSESINSTVTGTASAATPETVDLIVVLNQITAENRDFLAKVLESIGRSIDEIKIIEKADLADKEAVKQLLAQTQALFAFGVAFTELGFKKDLSPYTLMMAKEKHYLMGDSLELIMLNQNNEKRLLWNSLKNIL